MDELTRPAYSWTERSVSHWLWRHVFDRRHLLVVPNCSWPGSECDLLVVTNKLRIIDVEIKLTRADFKADVGKAKWFEAPVYVDSAGNWIPRDERPEPQRIHWPQKAWKHYYCLPEAIWKDDMQDVISPMSGVLLLAAAPSYHGRIRVLRQAKPCRDAPILDATAVYQIARLANFRQWDAVQKLESHAVSAATNNGTE